MLVSKNNPKYKINSGLDSIDKTLNYLLERKFNSTQKTLMRPLYQEVLMCLFLVFIIIVDTFIPLQILVDLPNIINIILALITLFIFLYVEIYIYNLLWGKNGHWSLDKYKKTSEKIKEDTNQ